MGDAEERTLENARAWLRALKSELTQGERAALFHAGPAHVRRLLRIYTRLREELDRLWGYYQRREAADEEERDEEVTPLTLSTADIISADLATLPPDQVADTTAETGAAPAEPEAAEAEVAAESDPAKSPGE